MSYNNMNAFSMPPHSASSPNQANQPQHQRPQFVFCHECQDEWRYTGEHSLICPSCQSDFVEIIENDHHDPSLHHMSFPDDEDDESDGETGHGPRFASSFVITGPGGFQISRTFGTFPGVPLGGSGAPRPGVGAENRHAEEGGHGAAGAPPIAPIEDMNMYTMLQSVLTSILGDQGAARVRQSARGNAPPVTGDHAPPDPRTPRPAGTPGADGGQNAGAPHIHPEVPDIALFLSHLFGPSDGNHDAFMQSVFPGARGDYVTSNAQLHHVLSELMEQHQGNAPPPAPPEVLNNLPKIKVDLKRVQEGEDCTVCKEELLIEEEVAQLPCKHVYHEECIKRWLETRDTCPICRAPTAPEHRQNSEQASSGGAQQNQTSSQTAASASAGQAASASQGASSNQHQQHHDGAGGLRGWLFGGRH